MRNQSDSRSNGTYCNEARSPIMIDYEKEKAVAVSA